MEPARAPTIPETARAAWRLLRGCLGGCLAYGVLFEVGAGLVLLPVLVWLRDRALALGGAPVATNVDIAAAVFSVAGLLAMLVWGVGVAALGVLGLGGPVVLAAAARAGHAPRLRAVAGAVVRATPRLVGAGVVRVGLFAAALVPILLFLVATLQDVVVGADRFVLQVVPASTGGALAFVLVLGALVAGLYVLVVRWTFLLPALLLEGRGLADAMRRSATLVSAARGRVLATVAGFHAAVLAVSFAAIGLFTLVVRLAFTTLAPDPHSGAFLVVAAILAATATALALVGTALFVAFGAAVVLALFEGLGGEIRGAPAGDDRRGPRRAVLLFAGLLVLGSLVAVPRVAALAAVELAPVEVTAHRGSAVRAPENTLAAFRLAIEEGADWIELDVMEAADGGAVCVHDVDLRRLAGVPRAVHELTVAELRQLDVGSHLDPRFAGERIPTLQEAIDLARGRARLNIEIKTHGRERRFPDAVVEIVQAQALHDACVITSLDTTVLARVRALDPTIRIGAIVTAALGDVHALDVDLYSVETARATVAFIEKAHARGRPVHVWTVNDARSMRLLTDRGADNLITDRPAEAVALRAARGADDHLRSVLVRLFDR